LKRRQRGGVDTPSTESMTEQLQKNAVNQSESESGVNSGVNTGVNSLVTPLNEKSAETSNDMSQTMDVATNAVSQTAALNEEEPEEDPVEDEEGPKKPNILRIGVDGKSEYISLDNMPINRGGFNQYRIGNGATILRNMYGIDTTKDKDSLNAMTTAFGVKNMDEVPPIIQILKKQCQFDGMNLVIKALQTRQRTLSDKIKMLVGTNKKREEQLLKWIESTIAALKEIPQNAKVCEPSAKKTYSFTLPGMPKISMPSYRKGCPCLEEMSMLRDLVVVVSMLMGIANEDVKQQLQKIPIQNLIQVVQGSNTNVARGKIQEVLDTLLLALQSSEKKGNATVPQEQLRIIYEELNPGQSKENITVDDILFEIRKILRLLEERGKVLDDTQNYEEKIQGLTDELERLTSEVEVLHLHLEGASEEYLKLKAQKEQGEKQFQTERLGLDEEHRQEIDAIRGATRANREEYEKDMSSKIEYIISQKQKEIDAIKADAEQAQRLLDEKTADLQRQIQDLTAEIERLKQASANSSTASTDALAKKEEELVALEEALERLRAEHAAEIQRLQDEMDALKAANSEKASSLASLGAEKVDLDTAIKAKDEEIAELQRQLKEAMDALIAKGASSDEQREVAQKIVDELRAKLAALEAEKEGLVAELAGLRSELEAKMARIAELEKQIQDMMAEYEKKLAAAEVARQEALENLSGESNQALEALRAELESTKDALKTCEDEKQQAAEASQAAAEAARQAADEAAANLQKLQEELDRVTAARDALQGQLEEKQSSESEEVATLRQQLDAAQAKIRELEGLIQEAADASATARANSEEKANQIANLEQQLQEASANSAAKNEQIADLERKLQEAEAEKAQLQTNLNTERASKPNELAAAKQQGAEEQLAADEKVVEQQEKDCDEKIKELESQLAQAKKELEDSNKASQDYVDDLQKQLQEAKNISSQKNEQIQDLEQTLEATRAATDEAKTGATQRNDEQKAEIDRLQKALREKEDEIEQKAQSVSDDTKRRLNTLLGTILLDPQIISIAEDYVYNGDDSTGSKLAAVQGEVCEFFRYLFDTIQIQLRQIEAIVPFRDLKSDIFKIFPGLTLTYDKKGLLKELAVFFQDFFARLHNAKAFGGESIDRKPILRKLLSEILAHMNRLDTPMLNQYKSNIKMLEQFKFLFDISAIATQNADSVQLGMYKQDESRKFTPLVVLAIKMIQLLAAEFYGKYGSLIRRCGLSSAPTLNTIMTGNTMDDAKVKQDKMRAEAEAAAARAKADAEAKARADALRNAELTAARAASLAAKAKTEQEARNAQELQKKFLAEVATKTQYTETQKKIIEQDRTFIDDIEHAYKEWLKGNPKYKCNIVYDKIHHLKFSGQYSKLDKDLNLRLHEIIKKLSYDPSTDCNVNQKRVLYDLSTWLNLSQTPARSSVKLR
jgi:DNA repair exonuclease SbcCD ATPase subunit